MSGTPADRVWDAVVVGAGPAGAATARALALRGRSVLLLDRLQFPRPKVCGCCINPTARAVLQRADVSTAATPLTAVRLAVRGRSADIPLSGWSVASRERLDAALVQSAVNAGAAVEHGVHVERLEVGSELVRVSAAGHALAGKIAVAADGLSGRLAGPATIRAHSRLGAGATLADAPDDYEPGRIYMACGDHGYVGLVRIEDGRLNVAAAFDAAFLRDARRPARAAARVMHEVGWPAIPALWDAVWRGTAPLTRLSRRPAGRRIFAVGDASGYVEPFTGEGIAWALAAGEALGAIAARPWSPAVANTWASWCRTSSRRRRFIRTAAWVLRRPSLAAGLLTLAAAAPKAAGRLIAALVTPG